MSEPHFPAVAHLRPSRPLAEAEQQSSRHTVRYKETHRTGSALPHLSVPSWVAQPVWACLVVAVVAATVKLIGVLF